MLTACPVLSIRHLDPTRVWAWRWGLELLLMARKQQSLKVNVKLELGTYTIITLF